MEESIIVKYGLRGPHKVHKQWLNTITKKTVCYSFIDLRKISESLGGLNQIVALIGSVFFPRAKIYLITGPGAAAAVAFNRFFFKSKVISINSDTFFFELERAGFFKRKYMLWLLSNIDALVSTSSVMANKAKKYTAIPNEIVHPFCDVSRFKEVKPNYESYDICSIATPRYSKGGDLLPKIHKIFRKEFPQSKMYVLGRGDMVESLKKVDGIVCTGFANPMDYLPKCGLYINPARIEPFGVNIIEAMCSGIPPLVTDQCGASDIVKMVDSWLVSRSYKQIAEKAIILQKDIKTKKKLGRKSRKLALSLTAGRSTREFKKKIKRVFSKLGVQHD